MKAYINSSMKKYPQIYPDPISVLRHLFCVLGNGIDLDHKGFIFQDSEAFEFGEPVALNRLYPYSSYNPVPLKYLGCANKGFKEAVQYFMQCLEISSSEDESIKEWKNNIHIFHQLLNAENIVNKYNIDEYDKFIEDIKLDKISSSSHTHINSVRKTWFFDSQWSDTPESVIKEIKSLWSHYELGNDHYMVRRKFDDELFDNYPMIYFWLKYKGVKNNEEVIINYWW